MVILKDIPFYSICEHHFMPFHGKAAVGVDRAHGRDDGPDLSEDHGLHWSSGSPARAARFFKVAED